MSVLQQIKDALSVLEDYEMEELYDYIGGILGKEPSSKAQTVAPKSVVLTSCEDDEREEEREECNIPEVSLTEEAPVQPGDKSDEESDAAEIPVSCQQSQSSAQPAPRPTQLEDLLKLPPPHLYQPQNQSHIQFRVQSQAQPSDGMWSIDRSSQDQQSTKPNKMYTLDTAKNLVQQYHQTCINPMTTPVYRDAWGDPDYKGRLYMGSSAVLLLQLEPDSEPIKFFGNGSKKVDAQKDAALKACEFLEQTGRLEAMRNKGRGAKPAVPSSGGLTPENAMGYLTHCKNVFVVNDVERPDAYPVPQGGFMAETIVVTRQGRQVFRTERPCNQKKQARNEADFQAALWVLRTTGHPVPPGMAR